LIKAYGEVKTGGMIQHLTYPDPICSPEEAT